MSFTVITHSDNIVLLQLPSLSLSLPLPLDEPVLMDATRTNEDKELAPSDMSARVSLYSTDTGTVLLSFLTTPLSLHGLRTFSSGCSRTLGRSVGQVGRALRAGTVETDSQHL